MSEDKTPGAVEELAMKMGWNPEHNGDAGRPFVSAEEFILRSRDIQNTMSNQLSSLSKTNKELAEGMKQLKTHYQKLTATEVARMKKDIADIKNQRDAAIDDGNKQRVRELDDQLTNLQKEATEAETILAAEGRNAQAGPSAQDNGDKQENLSPAAKKWLSDNKWYGSDDEMTAYIDTQAERFRGLPDDKYFAMLTKQAREIFPERFETTQKRPQAVEGQSLRPGKSHNKKFTFNDLTPEQKKWANFYKRQGVMETQEYVDELVKIGELR
jgi:hypothetical protein